jgi:serine/threonine-protein kinase RsbW
MDSKTFIASLDSLKLIRDFVSKISESVSLDNKKAYNLNLAIDEIATNIINYGYPLAGKDDGVIDVSVSTDDHSLTVTLIDSGIPFDPLKKITPTEEDLAKPLEEREIGGLGIMIARQSVDEFKYEYSDNKNRNIFIVNY